MERMLVRVRGKSHICANGSGVGFSLVAVRFSGWKSVTIAKARGVSGEGVRVLWWRRWSLLVLAVVLVVEEGVEEENSYVCELRRAITEPVGVRL